MSQNQALMDIAFPHTHLNSVAIETTPTHTHHYELNSHQVYKKTLQKSELAMHIFFIKQPNTNLNSQ